MSEDPPVPKVCIVEFATDAIDCLTLEQAGAYSLLLAHRWSKSAAVPDDDRLISHLLGVSVRRWRKSIRPFIERFFDLSSGSWELKSDRIDWSEYEALHWHEDFPSDQWGSA